jgi:putative surface-exposed virulence protein
MKYPLRLLFSFLVVTTLLMTAVTPALAEDPPPPPAMNPDGSSGKTETAKSASSAADPAPSADAAPAAPAEVTSSTTTDFTRMPNYSPGGVATSGMGAFVGEALVNTNGDPVQQGVDLASLTISQAMACAPGKLPNWLGGVCNNTAYTLLQDAINAALPGWTVWMGDYFEDYHIITVNKSITLQGSLSGSAYVGDKLGSLLSGINVTASNVSIRDVMSYGEVNVASGTSGVLRLQNVTLYSPNSYGLRVSNGYLGSVILSQVNAFGNYYRSDINVLAGAGMVTVVNSTFDNTQADNGLSIWANNKVKLENVEVSGNYGDGLYVEYAKGLSIKNGIFNNNYDGDHAAATHNPASGLGYGINAFDSGAIHSAVLLQNVNAAGNDEDGVNLDMAGAVTIKNSGFAENELHGLFVNGYKTISLDGVTAKNNGWWFGDEGVNLNASGAVLVSNSKFEGNYGTGLYVDNSSTITLKNVKAANNFGDGAYLYGGTAPVSVLGGYYDGNEGSGLVVLSRGNITLNGVVATWNNYSLGFAGVDIDNCDFSAGACRGTGNVSITNALGQNVISNNWEMGLSIYTHGAVSINTLSANDNGYHGVNIDYAHGNVTLTNVSANGNGQNNYGSGIPYHLDADGVVVQNGGAITLTNVSANLNLDDGIYLDNSYATSARKVTIKNIYAMDNGYDGVVVYSNGDVSLNHLNSTYNAWSGLYIGTSGGVILSNTLGANLVANNIAGGRIDAGKSVTITGLSASNNLLGQGMDVNTTAGTGSVTITNSQFNDNGTHGLAVDTKGNITLSNVQANDNFSEGGAWLHNNYLAGKSVTVNNASFNNNGSVGLGIEAGGAITLNGIVASSNYDQGLWARNDYFGSLAYNVTINSTLGANLFNNNAQTTGYDGVFIQTGGNVTISKATANTNGDDGFQITFTGGIGKKITFTCSTANNNADVNFYVNNTGSSVAVYLRSSGATGNGAGADYLSSGNTVNWFFVRTNCP